MVGSCPTHPHSTTSGYTHVTGYRVDMMSPTVKYFYGLNSLSSHTVKRHGIGLLKLAGLLDFCV